MAPQFHWFATIRHFPDLQQNEKIKKRAYQNKVIYIDFTSLQQEQFSSQDIIKLLLSYAISGNKLAASYQKMS